MVAAYETVLHIFYPSATVHWDDVIRAEVGPGDVRPVKVVGLARYQPRSYPGQFLTYGTVNFPLEQTQAIDRLKNFEPVPPGAIPLRVAVLYTNARGQILEAHQSTSIDLEPSVAVCMGLGSTEWPLDSNLPIFQLEYTGYYSRSTWVGLVDWKATFDAHTMQLISRVPTGSWKRQRNGRQEGELYLVNESADSTQITGQKGGRAFTLPCSRNCIVPIAMLFPDDPGSGGQVGGLLRSLGEWTSSSRFGAGVGAAGAVVLALILISRRTRGRYRSAWRSRR